MPRFKNICILLLLLLCAGYAQAQTEEKAEPLVEGVDKPTLIEVGDEALNFAWPEITYTNGQPRVTQRTLYVFRDLRNMLICFSPPIDVRFTPTWTRKFLSLPASQVLKDSYTTLVYVFPGNQYEVTTYRANNQIPLYMLGDEDHSVIGLYGVPEEVITNHWRNRRRRAFVLVGSDMKIKYVNYYTDEGEGWTELLTVIEEVGKEHVERLKAEGKWEADAAQDSDPAK